MTEEEKIAYREAEEKMMEDMERQRQAENEGKSRKSKSRILTNPLIHCQKENSASMKKYAKKLSEKGWKL